MFTKAEMQAQLREFMICFASSVGRMYGNDRAGALLGHSDKSVHDVTSQDAEVESTTLWCVVDDLYEYGVLGKAKRSFGEGQTIDAEDADVELFLNGLDSLEQYMSEDDVPFPNFAWRAVSTAIARHVLDGGARYRDPEEAWLMEGCLSFWEVALLADMDERSVRNAANPKLPDALVTAKYGKRTMVDIDDARLWLAGRKGFIPTHGDEQTPRVPRAEISLSAPIVDRLRATAKAAGLTIEEFIELRLASAGEQQPC